MAAEMTRDEALREVNKVRHGLRTANEALRQLHDRAGWRALGYDSFKALCAGEFGLSPQRAYQRLDHARTVEVMCELLDLDAERVTEAIPERLARDVKDHTEQVAEQAREQLDRIPAGMSPQRRQVETRNVVHRAAMDVRDRVRNLPPRRPEQSRRPHTREPELSPFERALLTGRRHAEAVQVLLDSQAPLSDVERMRLLGQRDEIIAVYGKLTDAWTHATGAAQTSGQTSGPATGQTTGTTTEARPATDPFLPPPTTG